MSQLENEDLHRRADALLEAIDNPMQALMMCVGMSHGELVALAIWLATALRVTGRRPWGGPALTSDAAINRARLEQALDVAPVPSRWGSPAP